MDSQKRKLRSITEAFDHGPCGLLTTAVDGTIVRVNQTVCRWTGYSADELVERARFQELLSIGARLLFSAHVAPTLALRKSVGEVRLDITTRAGAVLPVMLNVSRVCVEGEEFDELAVFVVEDRHRYEQALINARLKAEHELEGRRQAEDALREASRRKDEFLATLAHELRNPLAPMRNVLEMLSSKVFADPQLVWGREVFERQVHHMTRLVDDLLEMSRITQGKLELRREHLDLVSVLTAAVENSRPTILAASHELVVAIPGEPVMLHADPTRLLQMVQNLLDNSAKFTLPGGRIWLSANRSGAEVVITVRDTGIGIAHEDLNKVFDMFTQLDNAVDRTAGGLGIGLALVRELAALHGGSVHARSEGLGKGSRFVISLPVLEEASVTRLLSHQASRGTRISRRVLVVDDNRDAAISLSMVLQMERHQVQVAFDGISGFEAARESRPDVMILDIGMPDISGYEVARRVRQEPWGEGVELIALTGWGQEKDRCEAKAAGFDHHFTKPADLERLCSLIGESKGEPTSHLPSSSPPG
jgi:PAS domain S-box-containing protein